MSLSNGSETEFSPEDSGMKVEKQREIRAMKPDSVTKQYKTMSLMRWLRGMATARLKMKTLNDNPYLDTLDGTLPSPGEWSRPSMMKVLVSSRRALGRVALEFLGPPSCSSLVMSMPPPPSPKTAEAADPPPTKTGVATRTRMTSFGPAAASARPGRWSLRR